MNDGGACADTAWNLRLLPVPSEFWSFRSRAFHVSSLDPDHLRKLTFDGLNYRSSLRTQLEILLNFPISTRLSSNILSHHDALDNIVFRSLWSLLFRKTKGQVSIHFRSAFFVPFTKLYLALFLERITKGSPRCENNSTLETIIQARGTLFPSCGALLAEQTWHWRGIHFLLQLLPNKLRFVKQRRES